MNKKRLFSSHRGVNSIAPENTFPAFQLALDNNADEIEFDLRMTLDKEIVVIHDESIDRTTNGKGFVHELTVEEILSYDINTSDFKNYENETLKIPLFEELLEKFAGKVQMNIHVKFIDTNNTTYFSTLIEKAIAHLRQYNCLDMVYLTGLKDVLIEGRKFEPTIQLCCLEGVREGNVVENTLKFNCKRVQFNKNFLTPDQLQLAKENNITCNLFWSDDIEEANKYFEMGIDQVLTNTDIFFENK